MTTPNENRITPERIDALANSLIYKASRVPDTTTTLCVAMLPNGFVVSTGMSACVDPANFDEVKGVKYAMEDAQKKAIDKLWELEGYVLARKLAGEI